MAVLADYGPELGSARSKPTKLEPFIPGFADKDKGDMHTVEEDFSKPSSTQAASAMEDDFCQPERPTQAAAGIENPMSGLTIQQRWRWQGFCTSYIMQCKTWCVGCNITNASLILWNNCCHSFNLLEAETGLSREILTTEELRVTQ